MCAFPFDPAPTGTAASEVWSHDIVGVSTSTGGGTTADSSGTAGSIEVSWVTGRSTGAGSSMPHCFDAQCPDERAGPLEERGALEPLDGALVGQRVGGLPVVGHRRADVDPEGLADLGPRIAPRAGGDDQELAAAHLGHQAGKGGSEMDDPLERRIAQDDQGVAVCEHVADAAGEVGKEPAGVDDHVGVEGAERLRDGGPRLLVGHGALRRW